MNYNEVMKKLESLGTAQARKIYTNHGNDIDMFGVSMANLKKVLKPIKKDKELGLELMRSKNSDAMYLSQWIVDSEMLTIEDLEELIELTNYYMTLDTVIPNLAIKNKELTWQCINTWMNSDNPRKRQSAYSLYSIVLSKYPNDEIKEEEVLEILKHIETVIHTEENRVRYNMNNFVISAGIYNESLTKYCIDLSERIGKVTVFMGKTSCKVPFAPEYIKKVENMGRIGLKR